ncbi:methylglutaconyl-CoA hydratase, mitochondrial-like isoform X2 [Gordionus sp. m RMFG-2023]
MIDSLHTYIKEINLKNDVHLLLLRSTVPNIFCAGADLKERAKMPLDSIASHVRRLRDLFHALSKLPIPTIAAIDGTALGGGLEMCLACDIRIATAQAKMGLVEAKLGIIPGAGGTQRLPRLIGVAKAKELIFKGSVISGAEALKLGLVNEIVDGTDHSPNSNDPENGDDRFPAFNRALQLAKQMINQCSPLSLRCAKQAIDEGYEISIQEGLNVEDKEYEKVVNSNDRIEGLKAFLEKRQPIYKGI